MNNWPDTSHGFKVDGGDDCLRYALTKLNDKGCTNTYYYICEFQCPSHGRLFATYLEIKSQPNDVSSLGNCTHEYSIYYDGNDLNDGAQNIQPDPTSCRESCKFVNGSKYFAFNSNTNRCWCKSAPGNPGKSPFGQNPDQATQCSLGLCEHHFLFSSIYPPQKVYVQARRA